MSHPQAGNKNFTSSARNKHVTQITKIAHGTFLICINKRVKSPTRREHATPKIRYELRVTSLTQNMYMRFPIGFKIPLPNFYSVHCLWRQ